MKTLDRIEEYFRSSVPAKDRSPLDRDPFDPSTAAGWLLSRCVRRTDQWLGPVREPVKVPQVAAWLLGRVVAWGLVSYLSFDHFHRIVGKDLAVDVSWLFLFTGGFGWGLEAVHALLLSRIPAGTAIEAILAGIVLYATSIPVVSLVLALVSQGFPSDPPLALIVLLVLSPMILFFAGVYVGSAAGFGLKPKLLMGQVNRYELASYTLVGLLSGVGITSILYLAFYGPDDDFAWVVAGATGIFAVHNAIYNARPVYFRPGPLAIMVGVNLILAFGFAFGFWLCLVMVVTLLGNYAPTMELLMGEWWLAALAAAGLLSEESLAHGYEEWRDRVGVRLRSLRDLYAGALAGVLLLLAGDWLIPPASVVPSWAYSLVSIAIFLGMVWAGAKEVLPRAWRIVRRARFSGEPIPETTGKGWRATWEVVQGLLGRLQGHGAQWIRFPVEIAKAALRVPTLRGVSIVPS